MFLKNIGLLNSRGKANVGGNLFKKRLFKSNQSFSVLVSSFRGTFAGSSIPGDEIWIPKVFTTIGIARIETAILTGMTAL